MGGVKRLVFYGRPFAGREEAGLYRAEHVDEQEQRESQYRQNSYFSHRDMIVFRCEKYCKIHENQTECRKSRSWQEV